MRIPISLLLAISAFGVALVATPLVMVLARRIGAVDRPGPRRVHTKPIPTAGGLAAAIAVLGVAWGARLVSERIRELDTRPLIGLTLAAVVILILGLVDDVKGVRPWWKIAGVVAAAVVLYAYGYGIPLISNPFGDAIGSGVFNLPLTIGWVLVVVNAINLIDGLDGLATGVVLIASSAMWFAGRTNGDLYVMFLTALVIGATAGFLRFNFPPARVFMGDTGSQFLGLVLAAVALLENQKGTAAVTLLFPLVAFAVPVADSVIAFLRRAFGGGSVFRADAEHIHHRLLRLGLSQKHVVFALWFLSAYCAVMAVILATLEPGLAVVLALFLGVGIFFAFKALDFLDRQLSGGSRTTRAD
ncbi:MAG: MraY family glycosyltransferase [Acidimicrobiia bacterium]|nr:MAG: MraY family glycosyltransferase [Acidimicrobiia bacterium]